MERWKDIKGYEGRYQVSNLGNVKSLIRGIILKPIQMKRGKYLCLNLMNFEGKMEANCYIHVLVLEAFVSAKPKGNFVGLHLDGDTTNNKLKNLKWVTRKYAIQYLRKNGFIKNVISNKEVFAIRTDLCKGLSLREISLKFNIPYEKVIDLKHNKTHAYLEWPNIPKNFCGRRIEKRRSTCKLSEKDIVSIRKQLESKRVTDLAEKYKVNPSTISRIKSREFILVAERYPYLAKAV